MKKSIFILSLLSSIFTIAQTGIDKTSGFGASSLLEFGSANNRGILIEPVTDVTVLNATPGTIAFDGATGSFRYYTGSWSTTVSGGITGGVSTNADRTTQGAIINANPSTSTAEGVLILGKDTGETKALVLPLVSVPEFNVGSPPRGLMVYDTSNGAIKVYNGNTWTSF
ncbi:hypothetical protein EG347_11545 [Chryseobacterium sp. G0186]|uniref:hypothetical protein n=1 Tax=Chryseobacterium sp. G0186 TaxID=2487064 RepID=UPI000F4E418E|nr:hypothetical protein [Chryseobacterium sp. G0186]AZA78101.1 hypothetical protein EG347_11545 [Chryseobacterium sp. G0186]